MKQKILVIVGTTRQGRTGRKVADWYMQQVSKLDVDAEFELFDLAYYDLEVFNESASPMMHQYNDVQKTLAKKVGSADAFVFVTGEYNHSVPGSLKNFIDYLNAEWAHKASAYVGYGTNGGVRSIEHLVQIMNELRCASVRDYVTIHLIWDAFDDKGNLKDGYLIGNVEKQVNELLWWSKALQSAREAK